MRTRLLVLLALALFAAPGCGDSYPSPSPWPDPTPERDGGSTPQPSPVRTATIAEGTVPVGAGRVQRGAFRVPQAGTLEARAAWSRSSNNVDLFVTNSLCDRTDSHGTPAGSGCVIVCRDDGRSGNTARCSRGISGGGDALLFLVNFGPGGENVAFQVTLTR